MNPSLQLKPKYTLQQFPWIMRPLPPTLDRQQWQSGEQRACMTRHRWLFYSDEYIYSYFQRSKTSSCIVCAHTQNTHPVTSHSFLATSFWDNCFSCFSPLPIVWIHHSCWSPDWVKFKKKNIFLHWIYNIQTSASILMN